MAKGKKMGAMPVWKIVLLTIAAFVGLVGVAALAGFLLSDDDDVFPTEGIYFVDDNGQGFNASSDFSMTISANEIQSGDSEDEEETVVEVTAKKVTLSLNDVGYGTARDGEYITNHVIRVKENVLLDEPFTVYLESYLDNTYNKQYIRGGSSIITARSEYAIIETISTTVYVDVPAYEFSTYAYDSVAGKEAKYKANEDGEIEIIEDATFKLGFDFYPELGRYLYSNTSEDYEKMIAYSWTGTNVNNDNFFDYNTRTFRALEEKDTYTIDVYVFKSAHDQEDFLAEFIEKYNGDGELSNFELVNREMLDYFGRNPNSFEKATAKIKVTAVTVDSFSIANKSFDQGIVDKYFNLSSNSTDTAFDATLGVDIRDSENMPLNSVHARNVGIAVITSTVTNPDLAVRIVGGGYIMKVVETISEEGTKPTYQVTREVYSTETAKAGGYNYTTTTNEQGETVNTLYYILPDSTTSKEASYYSYKIASERAGTIEFSSVLFIQSGTEWSIFFKSGQNSIDDLGAKFSIQFSVQAETAIAWKENYNSAIVLEYDTDTHQSSSINLSEQIAVDLGNMYQTVKYFIYFSDGTAPDGFSAISTKTPPVRYVVGTDITYITGLNSGENVYLYELTTPVLKAVGQYTGNLNINVIAAIVKENVDGEIVNSEGGIYKAGDKYVFVSQTMNRGITISSTIPYSSFSATLEFSSSEEHYFNAGVEIGSGIYVPSELYTSAAASDSFTYRIYVDVQDDETVKSSMQDTLVQMVKEGSLNIIFDAANDAGRMLTLDTDTVTTGETASSGIPGYVRVYVSGNVIVSSEFYSVDGVKFTARLYYNNGNLAQNTKSVGYYYEDAEVGQDGVGFTLYTQVADATNTEFLFEEVATTKNEYDTNLPIEVSVSASTGTHIEWTSKELNLTDKTPIEMLNELIGLDVRDQLDRKILTSVASYSISQSSFTNREGEDVPYAGYNIATALEDKMVKILSFPSTGGNAVKTIMTFVITYKSSASATATFNYSKTLTFNIKSEGIEAVVYDTTDVATPEETQYAIVPSDGYDSIQISKRVTDRDELYLNSLFKVITSSSNADNLNVEDMLHEESALNNISVKDLVFKIDTSGYSESNLNALFAYHSEDIEGDGGTGASDSMLDLMTITDGMGNTKKINYNSEESVDVIKILYPFYVRTVLNFIVTDAYNIVNLRFQLIFEPNVTVRNRLSNYAAVEGYERYLSGSDEYPYAIPVFSGSNVRIPLDQYFSLHYLSLPDNSNQISWSNADESFAVVSTNNDFVSIENLAGTAYLKFTDVDGTREVSSREVVTVKIYFKSPELANYTFSMDLTFVINPDLLVVLKDDYVDLAELNRSSATRLQLENYLSIYRATEYAKDGASAAPIRGNSVGITCVGTDGNVLSPITVNYIDGAYYICRDTAGGGFTFDGLGKENKVRITLDYSDGPAEFVLVKSASSEDITVGVSSFEIKTGYGTPEETIAYLFDFGEGEEKTDKDNVELTLNSDGTYMLLLSAGQNEQYYLNEAITDVYEGENKDYSVISMPSQGRYFIIKTFNEFVYDSTIVFSVAVKDTSSDTIQFVDTIKMPVRFIIIGVSFSKYTDFVDGEEKIKEDYAYDIITSEKPEDLEENDYYQELVAGANYNVVNVISETTGPETFAHIWGITYKDPNDNSLSSVLSVYKIDGGYEGLVNIINNAQISIKPFAAQQSDECVYAILLLRLNRAIAGTIRYYNVYYRIKIIPNYQLGGVSYPYYNTDDGDEFGEYLKGDQFEIPLDEEFGVHNSSNSDFGGDEDSRFKELVDTDGNVITSNIRKEYTYSARLTDTGVSIDLETYFDAYTVVANGVLVLRLKERYASTPITFVITRTLYRGDDFVYNSKQSYTIYLNSAVEYVSELDALVERQVGPEQHETEKVRQTADENGEYNIDLSVNQTYQYELSVFERTGNIDVPQLGLNAHILNDDAVNYVIKANAPYATSLDQFVNEGSLNFYTQDITITNFKISDENPFIVEYEFINDKGITEIRYTPTMNIFLFGKTSVFIADLDGEGQVKLKNAEIQSVDKDIATYRSFETGLQAQTKTLEYYVEGEMRYINFNIMANQSEEDIEGFDKVYTGLGVVDNRIDFTTQVLGDAANAYSTSYISFSFVTSNILRIRNSNQGTFYINKDYRNILLNCVNFTLASEMQMPGGASGNANAYTLNITVVDSISKDENFSIGVYNKYGDIVIINYTIKGGYNISLGSENVPYKWTSGNTYALGMFINVTEKLDDSGTPGGSALSRFEYAAEGPNAKYISFGTLFENSINVAFTKEDFEVTIVATEKENQSLGDGQYSRYKYSFRFTISFKAGFNSVVVRNYPERVDDILSVYSQQTFEINVDKDDDTNADKSDIYRKYLYSIMARKAYNAAAIETPIDGVDAEQLNKDFFRFVDDAELGDGTIDDTTYRKTDSVTAEDVSDVETKQIVHKLGYFFNGNLIFTFNVNYSYRIKPNVDVKHHYPILVNNVAQTEDGKEKATDIEMQEEYVDGVTLDGEGTTIVNFFNTKASFTSGNDNRITVNLAKGVNESLDINYNISIAISDSRNATIFCKGAPLVDNEIYNGTKARKDMSDEDDILEDLDLTFTLQSTATTGYVTFIVTVNERATDYTVFINNVSSFAVTENYTANKTGTEVVYVEDYKDFTNTNVFQYARLMTYQFRPGVSTSATYYLRFEADNKIPFIKEVKVTQESINNSITIDLGDSYVGYAFEGAYATASAAQQGTARITQELFAITPYIHNRINLTYMGYGISDKVYKIALQKQGTDTYAAMEDISIKYNNEETENYIIGYVSTSSAISSETVTKTDYVYRLQVAFEFSSEYDPRSGLQELSAGTTYNLFDNAHSFGFKNARTGNYYSAETVVEDGSITLQLFGFADNKFADNREILEKYNYLLGDLYTFESLQELLKPSSRTEIDQPFTDPTYNYLVTVADNGLRKFELQAQGATNEGNYVLVKLSFASMFGGEPVQKDIDLLIKINPSYDIKYMVNDDAQTATRSALDIYNTSTGLTSKLIASNYDPQNLLGEYYRINHPVIAGSTADGSNAQFIYNKENKNKSIIVINKKVGTETGTSDIFYTNEFVYKMVMDDGIYNNYMKDKEGIELNTSWRSSKVDEHTVYTYTGGSEDSISFVMYRPKLGTKYYYIEGEDKWGYIVRLYFAVDPEINPQLINLSAVADTPLAEGRDTIGIGAYYSKVTPISQKQGDTTYDYSYQFPKADTEEGAPKVTLYAQIGEKIYNVNVSDDYYDFYIQNKEYKTWASIESGRIASGTNITLVMPKLRTSDLSTIFGADPDPEIKKAFEGNASQINYGAIEVTYSSAVSAPITDITKQQPNTAGSTLAFGIDGLQTYMFDIGNDLSMLYTGDRWATKLEDYKITGVRFEKDNRPIGIRIPDEDGSGYTEGDTKQGIGVLYKEDFETADPIGTDINSYYYKNTDEGIKFGQGAQMNTIKLPYFEASAYGVASQMTVQLVITLELSTNETHELRADIVVSKSAAGVLNKTDFLDTEVISSESFESQGEGTTPGGGDSEGSKVNIYNNTLELEFKEHGKAIEYYVDDHADDKPGTSKVVEYATLSNENRDYVHREQLKLITGLSVVDDNTKVDLYIKAADESDEPDVRVLYGGKDVSGTYDTEQQAFKYTISIKEFTKQDGSADENIIRLNIEDVSEVEISGYANRTIYSLATDQNIGFAYQQEKVIKVHKIYDSVTASKEAAAGLGYYIVDEYSKLTTNGKDTYIIDPKQWAGTQISNGKIAYTPGVENSDPTDEKFPLGAAPIIANNPYMFTFSAVGATVDANGIITTAEEFDINAASGILVTIYMKVSGADGNFESDESIEIGTVRFRLSQGTSPTEVDSVADKIFAKHGEINDSNSIGTFIVKCGEEFKFEERMMDTLKNVGSEQAYRNIQIRIVNENYEKDGAASAEIIRNNLDKYVYTTEGKYNSRFIISIRDGDSITYLQFVAEVLVYDDSNPEERTLVVDMADLTGDSPKTLKDYLAASGAVYCTEMGVAADVSENGLKIFLQNIESIADLPTGIYDHGFILSQESGFKYVEVRFFIYDSSKDLTAEGGENITIAIGNRSNYRFTNLNKLLEDSGVTIQKIYSDDEGTIVDAGESEYFNLSSNFTQDRTYYMLLSDGTLQRAVIKFAIFNVTNDPTAQWWKGEMGEEGEYTGKITAEEIQKILGRNGEVYALDSSTNVMTKITEDGVDTITWTSANEVTKGYIIKSGENYFHHSIRYSRYINTLELTEILDTYNPLYNLSQLDPTVKSALSLESGALTWRDADLHDRPTVALDAIEFAAAENRVITIVSYIRNGGEYYQVTIHFAYGGDHKIHFNPTFEEGTETRTLAELDDQLLAEEEAKGLTGKVTWYVNSQECEEIKISDFVGKQVRIGVKIGDVYCVVYIEFTKAE